jgi:hypothetical protein
MAIELNEMDKRTEIYPIRVPEITKHHLDKLSPKQKSELNEKILLAIAEAIHMANFDPKLYLASD